MGNSIEKKIFRGTMVIILVGILAKITSFIQEAILAAYLGTTNQSDAFYMVSSIQAVIYPMLSVGVWKVFLPLYKEKYAQGKTGEADALSNQMISFFSIVSFFAVCALILLAVPVVSVVAPGFEGETKELCAKLVRISAPMYFFIIAAAIYASMLQAHGKFFGSQVREIASHVPTIIAALFFYKNYGIEAMAVALVAGGFIRLLIELPFVDWGYRFHPDFRFKTSEFRIMLKRLPSALVSESVGQLNTLIDKVMASTLPEGTISGLNYGGKLSSVFGGLLSGAIATALYPQMIEMIALKKIQELARLVAKIINIFCVLMVPITVACMLFSRELVTAAFQRGSFAAESTTLTANIFALYCMGLFFGASNSVVSNVFYSFGDTKRPMFISLINLGINVALNLCLIQLLGVNGLALATSLSAIITFFVRNVMVRKYVHLEYKKIFLTFLKVLGASGVACFAPRILFWIHPVNPWLILIISAAMGILIYLGMIKLLRVKELEDLLEIIKNRFWNLFKQ